MSAPARWRAAGGPDGSRGGHPRPRRRPGDAVGVGEFGVGGDIGDTPTQLGSTITALASGCSSSVRQRARPAFLRSGRSQRRCRAGSRPAPARRAPARRNGIYGSCGRRSPCRRAWPVTGRSPSLPWVEPCTENPHQSAPTARRPVARRSRVAASRPAGSPPQVVRDVEGQNSSINSGLYLCPGAEQGPDRRGETLVGVVKRLVPHSGSSDGVVASLALPLPVT